MARTTTPIRATPSTPGTRRPARQFINGVGQGAPGGNKIFQTIWDGNGVDTYDFSNYATNLSVDLRAGGWTTVSAAQLADLGGQTAPGAHMAAGNIANAWLYNNDTRSLIENAIGGSGNDSIIGNQANNVLTGGAGNDVLYGLAGNDTLDGGLGSDTAVFTGASSNYQVSRGANGSLYITDLRAGSPDGSDVLVSVENLQFSNGVFSPSALGIAAPVAQATSVTLVHGQAVAASWMFSTSTPYIQQYRFFELCRAGWRRLCSLRRRSGGECEHHDRGQRSRQSHLSIGQCVRSVVGPGF